MTGTSGEQATGFRGPQVCAIVGITYRQLDYWARTDLLRPSLADAKGSGSQRLYSYRDLFELKVIKQLLDAGVKLQQARRALACLREAGEELATTSLVLAGEGSVLARTGEEIIDLLKGGQGVFNIVPLAGVATDIEAAVHRIGERPAGGPGSAEQPETAAGSPGAASPGRLAQGS